MKQRESSCSACASSTKRGSGLAFTTAGERRRAVRRRLLGELEDLRHLRLALHVRVFSRKPTARRLRTITLPLAGNPVMEWDSVLPTFVVHRNLEVGFHSGAM